MIDCIMKLDKCTFGHTPAALYLALLLAESDNKNLLRKVAKVLSETRKVLRELEASHQYQSAMSTQTFGIMLELVHEQTKVRVAGLVNDKFIGQIVQNILTGEIRTLKKRCSAAAVKQRQFNRGLKSGQSPMDARAEVLSDEYNKAGELKARSAKHLAKRGKQNTLYLEAL